MTSSSPRDADGAARAALAPLDEPSLVNLARLDPTGTNRLVPRVLATYRSSLRQLLDQLQQASAHADLAGIRLAAHTLKSSSASIGALLLSADCGAVEQAARDEMAAELPPLIATLLTEAARVDAAVQNRLIDSPTHRPTDRPTPR